jgi:putative flippase GtrA
VIARARRMQAAILSSAARPLRFAGTGGVAGTVQILFLTLLTHWNWNAIPANALAFSLAAQVNFALSSAFTWRDRAPSRSLARRWLLFHASIGVTALLNMVIFAAARLLLPMLAASAAGIAAGALGNYLIGDRLVFRRPGADDSPASGSNVNREKLAA